jgi:hypothetical protein
VATLVISTPGEESKGDESDDYSDGIITTTEQVIKTNYTNFYSIHAPRRCRPGYRFNGKTCVQKAGM